jgi:lipooligosaccharide transport system permease protein
MTASSLPLSSLFTLGSRRARFLVERNIYVYRRTWIVLLSGFFEPLFYLGSIGFGLGALVGAVAGPGGQQISYQLFVAPALHAAAEISGEIADVADY